MSAGVFVLLDCEIAEMSPPLEDIDLPLTIEICLSWDESIPYEVIVTLPSEPEDVIVSWSFSRDLLDLGVLRGDGEGNVRIEPWDEDEKPKKNIRFILRSGSHGSVTLKVPIDGIDAFMEETYNMCPTGDESIEGELDRFLSEFKFEG